MLINILKKSMLFTFKGPKVSVFIDLFMPLWDHPVPIALWAAAHASTHLQCLELSAGKPGAAGWEGRGGVTKGFRSWRCRVRMPSRQWRRVEVRGGLQHAGGVKGSVAGLQAGFQPKLGWQKPKKGKMRVGKWSCEAGLGVSRLCLPCTSSPATHL